MEKLIRLMLVDDHDVVRAGLKSFLESQNNLQVVAETGNGEDAIKLAKQTCPDVVVMDITMPGMDGMETTRKLKMVSPECRVLALTVHEDQQYFFQMLAAGASGYMTKQAAADELVSAIRTVAQGNVYLQPTLARWLLDDYMRLANPSSFEDKASVLSPVMKKTKQLLSDRERQVLELVAQGNTNQEISNQLKISPKTVARHRERIMKRLNLHTSTELVKYAIKMGLIEI